MKSLNYWKWWKLERMETIFIYECPFSSIMDEIHHHLIIIFSNIMTFRNLTILSIQFYILYFLSKPFHCVNFMIQFSKMIYPSKLCFEWLKLFMAIYAPTFQAFIFEGRFFGCFKCFIKFFSFVMLRLPKS